MTNRDRIKNMSDDEIIEFFKHIDFNKSYPIIEGIRFFNKEEIIEWLDKEVDDVRV